jgi:hypothetical protein
MIGLHIPGFVKIDLFIQKLIWGGGVTDPENGDLINLFYFFKILKVF